MRNHDVWFAIPSANPEKCRRTLRVWREYGYRTAVLVDDVMSHPADAFGADVTLRVSTYHGYAASVNTLCKTVVPKEFPIVVTGGDDMLPDPNHSADELAAQFLERFPDTFGVMQPHGDAYMASNRYCGSPFLGRAWFESMYGGRGGMYPGYHHNYADNELFWVARGMGALWERPDLSHFHEHFTRDGSAAPAYWDTVKKNDMRDCLLYYSRVHERFAGHEPLETPATRGRGFNASISLKEMLVLVEQRLLSVAMHNPFADAIAAALRRCKASGHDTVALYGFGLFTQSSAAALCEPPVRVACIIDDNESNQGRTPWGIPVVSRDEAMARGIKAVVLTGNSVQDRLWANSEVFRQRGIAVLRLDGKGEQSTTMQTAA